VDLAQLVENSGQVSCVPAVFHESDECTINPESLHSQIMPYPASQNDVNPATAADQQSHNGSSQKSALGQPCPTTPTPSNRSLANITTV